ncbi:MAG: rod shape-determining protein RodA [Gammaproteobacteria bacterium]|nr:rod shape-determining protein RodA [Gammaproteobacteria bacterium]
MLSLQTMFNALHGEAAERIRLFRVQVDPWLVFALCAILVFGLVVLNSAAQQDSAVVTNQALRVGIALVAMVIAAQVDPHTYLRWAPTLYVAGIVLLVIVLLVGTIAKGSQRWLDLPGLPRFQPSEIMKIAVPLVIAWYLHDRPLPPGPKHLLVAVVLLAVPAGLIALQPDLGTSVMVAFGGLAVIVMSGLRWRFIAAALGLMAAAAPALWFVLRDYQKRRVLTFLNPEADTQGAGWNIIQSKIAIGSGGVEGKGLFNGTQSRLDFLPESHTDFILAVIGEELGLRGMTLLLLLYLVVVARALFMATRATETFGRLAASSLTLVFFGYVFVNIGMVSGLLPVVGVPLPLVSYGGTSAITLLVGFGIVMAIHTHRRS